MAEYPIITASNDDHSNSNSTIKTPKASTYNIPQEYSLNKYQRDASQTAIYPGSGTHAGVNYAILGLIGEAGEIANKFKKYYRDNSTISLGPNNNRLDTIKQYLRAELGDVLWYVAILAAELDTDLSEIAKENISKLADRHERNAISGSGDYR
jgi:NTP pyrophosphatase (non-canonical NTP hydrolase)